MDEMTIDELARTTFYNNLAKGIYDHNWTPREYLAHLHSEVSEAYKELEKGHKPDEIYTDEDGTPHGVPIEIADVLACACSFAEYFGFSASDAVQLKQEYEKTRPYKHGKEF